MQTFLCQSFFVVLTILTPQVNAKDLEVDYSQSLLGAVVYKAGVASGLAHNHLIFADQLKSYTLTIPEDLNLEKGEFNADVAVADLKIDDWPTSTKWKPLLTELELLNDDVELSELKTSDQKSVTEKMKGDEQLDGEKFPSIAIKVRHLQPKVSFIGKVKTNFLAKLQIQIHGKTEIVEWPASINFKDDALDVVVSGPLEFRRFGIEPISALLGAIKNKNEFNLVVKLSAKVRRQ